MRASHRVGTALAVAGVLFTGAATIHGDSHGADLNRQLAAARAATAVYHDPDAAIAAGYQNLGPNPAEDNRVEFVNFNLVFNCTLDVTQPEALSYVTSGQGLRLVGVEYSYPMACGAPPEDFLPGIGEWEPEAGAPVWSKFVPLWSGNSIGSH